MAGPAMCVHSVATMATAQPDLFGGALTCLLKLVAVHTQPGLAASQTLKFDLLSPLVCCQLDQFARWT